MPIGKGVHFYPNGYTADVPPMPYSLREMLTRTVVAFVRAMQSHTAFAFQDLVRALRPKGFKSPSLS